jgi:hypothetical protein
MDIRTETAQIPFREYINRFFSAVYSENRPHRGIPPKLSDGALRNRLMDSGGGGGDLLMCALPEHAIVYSNSVST